MSALVCLSRVQERVLVLFLVAAAFGMSIVVVGIMCLDLGRPGIVFAVIAAGVIGILLLGVVGKDAFAEKLVHVVSGDSAAQGEEDTGMCC